MHDKLSSTQFRSLKCELQSTKDESAKVATSNRVLRKRVRVMEGMVENESLKHEKECDKNKKAMKDFNKTHTLVEHYFKLEIEKLKKRYGVLIEHVEGHEEVCSLHINERGENDMLPYRNLNYRTG
ncbi:unnamed protein product [Prunus armeniaca]